jgi:hypothetical protein
MEQSITQEPDFKYKEASAHVKQFVAVNPLQVRQELSHLHNPDKGSRTFPV